VSLLSEPGPGNGPAGDGDRPAGRTDQPVSFSAELGRAMAEQFSNKPGGLTSPRGLAESVLPMTVFSAAYGLGLDLKPAVLAALAVSVFFALWRLVRREPVMQAVGGVFGIALGAWLALRTGRAVNFALPSLWKNSIQLALFAVSALVRWPLVGVMLGFVVGEGLHWRAVPRRARAYAWATWLWAGMFAVRLAVQVPLWLAGAAAVLALANVVLGLPLFALVLWGTWAIVKRVPVATPPLDEPGDVVLDPLLDPLRDQAEPEPDVIPGASPG